MVDPSPSLSTPSLSLGSPAAFFRKTSGSLGRALKRRKKTLAPSPSPVSPHGSPLSVQSLSPVSASAAATRKLLDEAARVIMEESCAQHASYWDSFREEKAIRREGESSTDPESEEEGDGPAPVPPPAPLPEREPPNGLHGFLERTFCGAPFCFPGSPKPPPPRPSVASLESCGEEVILAPPLPRPPSPPYRPPEPCITRLVPAGSPSSIAHDVAILQLTSADVRHHANPDAHENPGGGYEVLSPRTAYGQHTGELARQDSYLGCRSSASSAGRTSGTGIATKPTDDFALGPAHLLPAVPSQEPPSPRDGPPPPHQWPQKPLLLRPTPRTNMQILGIRYAEDDSAHKDYLQFPRSAGEGDPLPPFCARRGFLPINNGTEERGRELVFDFRSDQFEGTAMVRVLGAPPHAAEAGESYFEGLNRKFQVVVRGRFTRPHVPLADTVTGQVFSRPGGGRTPKWMLRSAVRLITFFAPQLEAGFLPVPRFVSPLVSTAQTVVRSNPPRADEEEENRPYRAKGDIAEHEMQEPLDPRRSILSDLSEGTPSTSPHPVQRARHRKKVFDKFYAAAVRRRDSDRPVPPPEPVCTSGSCGLAEAVAAEEEDDDDPHRWCREGERPSFRTDREYTFEFLQHLVSFDDFSIDMGAPGLRAPLTDLTDGQPLKIMAAVRKKPGGAEKFSKSTGSEPPAFDDWSDLKFLWAFDIWHENLFDRHQRAESGEQAMEKPKT